MRKIILLLVLGITGCSNDRNIFNGQFISINRDVPIELTAEKLDLEMFGAVNIHIIDTFMIANCAKLPFHFSVFSLKTFNHLGDFIEKGAGPNEFMYININKLRNRSDSGAKLWFSSIEANTLYAFDIEESVKQKKTIINDTIFKDSDFSNIAPSDVIYITDSIMVSSSIRPGVGSLVVLNRNDNSIKSSFSQFKKDVLPAEACFGGSTVKPDGTKWAQAMILLDQLNICNIDGSDAKSISFSKNPTLINTTEEINPQTSKLYYRNIESTDNFIIASYVPLDAKHTEFHIFDWNGKLVHILKTDQLFPYFALDKNGNNIYGFESDDKIYSFRVGKYIDLK